jgi:hypothetical protein
MASKFCSYKVKEKKGITTETKADLIWYTSMRIDQSPHGILLLECPSATRNSTDLGWGLYMNYQLMLKFPGNEIRYAAALRLTLKPVAPAVTVPDLSQADDSVRTVDAIVAGLQVGQVESSARV